MENKKVWFVTGASKGLGLSLVKKLLAEGFNVAATSRSVESLTSAVGAQSENFLPLAVDIVNEHSVQQAIDATIKHFAKLDVVVNNAGYGHLGTLEELSDSEVRQNFDVNVFGSLNVIRYAMPHLRVQGSGHIFNISSIGGITGRFPGWGIYCATKFAVVGFSESLATEVKEFGVKVTAVCPGYFRTEFLSGGSLVTPANPIAAYTAAREMEAAHKDNINGNQAGDPDKAANALIALVTSENPPVVFMLGSDAYNVGINTANAAIASLNEWKALTSSTDFVITEV